MFLPYGTRVVERALLEYDPDAAVNAKAKAGGTHALMSSGLWKINEEVT
jgi:hypothetical protein